MKNTLRKYDDVLTADERFRLALAAMARDDDTEIEHLFKTCPRYTYTMTDIDFADRFHKSNDAAVTFGLLWLWSHKQYVEALWLLSTYRRAVDKKMTTLTIEEVMDLFIKRCAELKATYVGLVRFCTAARLDWRELLHWWSPLIDEIESVRAFVLDDEEIEAPEEMVAVAYRVLANILPVPLDPDPATGGAR
jgi:hypothetical protein